MHSHTSFSSKATSHIDTHHLSRAELRAAKSLEAEYQTLLLEAERVQKDLQAAQHNFNYLSGQKDIDACIFRIRTTQCRYESLLSSLQDIQNRMQNLSQGETYSP